MKGSNCLAMKPYVCVTINVGLAIAAYNYFETEKEAQDFGARAVATAKGGEAVVLKATTVTKLPTPDVETIKVD